MLEEIDIIEDNILKKYPKVLDILLLDHTTGKNIFWATDNYEHLGDEYQFLSQINTKSITGLNSKIIMPRVLKNKILQKTRSKEMAEVYTPSWVCNEQINAIDNSWFGKKNVFNKQVIDTSGTLTWKTNKDKIQFPENKTWKDYVDNIRLEITCGEAPYLASRYDTTTGKYIPASDRIGLLDRKLRVISENIKTKKIWLKYTELAYKSIYGYEYHGDSLLLARESLLYTFIDNHIEKFNSEPKLEDIQKIAYILSWNLWQMDGLKCVVPQSCKATIKVEQNLFENATNNLIECKGCKMNDIHLHNGIYCIIMDWTKDDLFVNTGERHIKFIDLVQKEGVR